MGRQSQENPVEGEGPSAAGQLHFSGGTQHVSGQLSLYHYPALGRGLNSVVSQPRQMPACFSVQSSTLVALSEKPTPCFDLVPSLFLGWGPQKGPLRSCAATFAGARRLALRWRCGAGSRARAAGSPPMGAPTATAPRARACTCQFGFQPRCLHTSLPRLPLPLSSCLVPGPRSSHGSQQNTSEDLERIIGSFISGGDLGFLPPISHLRPCSRGDEQKGKCDPKFLLSLDSFSWLSCVKSL